MSDEKRDKIRALSDREQAREKLPIFYGSRENYLHGFKEVLGNAVDEINNNYSRGIINVFLSDDLRTISVSDTGRGIPIEGETDGTKNYELLFETLFAGTNYDNMDFDKIAVGTNGVGITVLNYTSELFKVFSYRNGKKYSIEYNNGGQVTDEGLTAVDSENPKLHGSTFIFRLDPEIYTNTKYKPEDIRDIVKRTAATANKIKFKFRYDGEVTEFHYEDLEDYFEEVTHNLTSKPVLGPESVDRRDSEINKIRILFSTSSDPIQESYLNINWLPENGTIHDGVIWGVRNFVNNYAKEKSLINKKTNITPTDVEDSISYVASVLSNNVEYANQTKLSTNKRLYRTIVADYVKSLLEAYQAEQPKEFEKFVKHIVQVNKFNNRNSAAKRALRRKLTERVDGLNNRVEALVDCSNHGKDSELFIAEGLSALGSIVLARDGTYQAAYPLRGKILNCLKADYPTIFKNQVITDLVRVLGCGIETDKRNKDLGEFDINSLRFGKIIIATDADADGQQIACLIITMFYRLMPQLIRDGYIYIAKTPLYEVKLENDEMVYFYSEQHKDEEISKLKGKYTIQRCKGLGELEAEVMAETAMDPATRRLERVTVEDAEAMADMIDMFMGQEVRDRKQYIEDNLYKYIDNVVTE